MPRPWVAVVGQREGASRGSLRGPHAIIVVGIRTVSGIRTVRRTRVADDVPQVLGDATEWVFLEGVMRGAEGQQRSHARRAAVRLPVNPVRRVAHPQPREPSARAVSHDADVAFSTRTDGCDAGIDGV